MKDVRLMAGRLRIVYGLKEKEYKFVKNRPFQGTSVNALLTTIAHNDINILRNYVQDKSGFFDGGKIIKDNQ